MESLVRFAKVVGLSVVLGTCLNACTKVRTEVVSPDLSASPEEAAEGTLSPEEAAEGTLSESPLLDIRADAIRLPDGALREEKVIIAVGGGKRFIDTEGNVVFFGERSVVDAYLLEDGRIYWMVVCADDRYFDVLYQDHDGVMENFTVDSFTEAQFHTMRTGDVFLYLRDDLMSHWQQGEGILNRKGEWLFKLGVQRSIRFYEPKGVELAYVVVKDFPGANAGMDDTNYDSEERLDCSIYSLHTMKRIHAIDLQLCGGFGSAPFPVMVKDRWGYMNLQGEMVIPAQFEMAEPFKGGLAWVKLSLKHAEALCGSSKRPPRTQNANVLAACKDGLATWKKAVVFCDNRHDEDKENEYIDSPCIRDDCDFTNAGQCRDGWVNLGWAYINNSGEIISRFDYAEQKGASTYFNSHGFAIVKRNGLYGVINEDGQEVIFPNFENETDVIEAAVAQGLWSNDEEDKTPPNDDNEAPSRESVVTAWGSSDQDGNFAVEGFCTTKSFSAGLILAVMDCRGVSEDDAEVGHIIVRGTGLNGELATPIHRWSEDVLRKGYGAVDHRGEWLVTYRIRSQPVSTIRGLSYFEIQGEFEYEKGWINAQGKIIWPPGWGDPGTDTGGNVIWVE